MSTNRQVLPPRLDHLVDRVAGRAGDRVDDDALGAGQLVEQRRLADVRSAEECHAPGAASLVCPADRRHHRQDLEDRVEQVAAPPSVQGGHRPRLPEPEVPQARGVRLEPLVVHLVGHEDDRLARPAQQPDDGLVGVGGADHRVDDEDDDVREIDRDLGLFRDAQVDAGRADLPPTRVDQREPAAGPLRVVGHAVAGDSGRVLDDRLAAAEDPVDQRGLADVRAAHDGDHRLRPLGERDEPVLTGHLEEGAVLLAEVEVLQAGAQHALHALVLLQVSDVGSGGVGPWVGHVKPRSVCLWCGWADPPLFQAGACSRTTARTAAIAS